MNDFEKVMSAALTDDQKDLLVCMLARLACADGHIDPFEVDFFRSFLGDHLGPDIAEGIRRVKPVTAADMGRRSAGNAEAIYMLCSLLSCVDEHVDAAERATLAEYATALGLDEGRRDEIDSIARRQVLDQVAGAMAGVPGFPPEKLKALESVAERLGATAHEVDEAAKRHDLA